MIKRLSILLLAMVVLAGCSSDDSSVTESSDFVFNDVSYNFTEGFAVDRGGFTEGEESYAMLLGTSSFTLNEEALPGVVALDNAEGVSALLSFELESISDSFTTGIYTFDQSFNDLITQKVIVLSLRFPGPDGIFNLLDDIYLSGTAGTVTVSGSSPNFTLDISMDLNTGETLDFIYSEGMTYVDGRWD